MLLFDLRTFFSNNLNKQEASDPADLEIRLLGDDGGHFGFRGPHEKLDSLLKFLDNSFVSRWIALILVSHIYVVYSNLLQLS